MRKLKLHKPHGKNRYCGPAAMSAITGFSSDECATVVRLLTGKTAVKGMHDWQMSKALVAMGGTVRHHHHFGITGGRTFKQWMDDRSEEEREKLMVVTVTGHYVTVLRDLMVDNQSGKEFVHYAGSKHARRKYRSAMVIEPPAKGWVLPAAAKAHKRKAGTNWKAKATKLAAELGMHVYKESSDMYYVGSEADDQDLMEHLATGNRLSGYNWEDLYQGIIELYDEAKDYIAKHGRKAA